MTCFKLINEVNENGDTIYGRRKRVGDGFDFAKLEDLSFTEDMPCFYDITGKSYPLEAIYSIGVSKNKVIHLKVLDENGNEYYPQVDSKNSSVIINYLQRNLCAN